MFSVHRERSVLYRYRRKPATGGHLPFRYGRRRVLLLLNNAAAQRSAPVLPAVVLLRLGILVYFSIMPPHSANSKARTVFRQESVKQKPSLHVTWCLQSFHATHCLAGSGKRTLCVALRYISGSPSASHAFRSDHSHITMSAIPARTLL